MWSATLRRWKEPNWTTGLTRIRLHRYHRRAVRGKKVVAELQFTLGHKQFLADGEFQTIREIQVNRRK
ncbi:MAG: hypothetical protein OXN90_08615 [Gemmatimonadota bacterium]|nr:hypothetical protein [Gemmatimonadota bacterium]